MNFMVTFLAYILSAAPIVKDYGPHGQTFPIEEEDLIEYLQQKTQSLTPRQIAETNQKLQENYKRQLTDPHSLKIQTSTSFSVHYFDPTVVAKQDIKDSTGNIIVAKGTSYNPLHHFSLLEPLLFLLARILLNLNGRNH